MKTPTTALALCLSLTACGAQLQHGLDERDANELVTVLVARGLEAKKVPEKGKKPTWAIEIDVEHANEALRVLTELKLPRVTRATTRGLMQTTSLIETPSTERLRQLEAQEGDLEEALETMDGVTSAAVELVVPAPPRPGSAPVPSKASVLVRVRPEALERLDQHRPELRALVAAGVDGLKSDDVVLVIDPVTLQPLGPVAPPVEKLHLLLVGLSLALTGVAGLVMVLAWRLRLARQNRQAAAPTAHQKPAVLSPPAQRPGSGTGVQRKVA